VYWLTREPDGTQRSVWLRQGWTALATLALAGALLYPLGATLSRTNGLSAQGRTLNGLDFAFAETPDDYATAEWLRRRVGLEGSVLEAVGGQYSPEGRLSAWSGVATVMGWPGHEVQWGRDGTAVAIRQQDVELAYTSPSLADAVAILRKYGVTYVYVGRLERTKYSKAGLEKFEGGLPEAFRVGESVLYRVPPEGVALTQGDAAP
jgi:uncharacterized membrane protein